MEVVVIGLIRNLLTIHERVQKLKSVSQLKSVTATFCCFVCEIIP
jgi:hypothetical protein